MGNSAIVGINWGDVEEAYAEIMRRLEEHL